MANHGPSERVTRILLSRGMPLLEIQALTEGQAWDAVNETEPRARQAAPRRLHVCFTGFAPDEREALESMAIEAGHDVTRSVIKSLDILVCGDTPGPSKLEKARSQAVEILTAAEYKELAERDHAAGSRSAVAR
jgi:NAD-dependent DNA ligase